MSCVGLFWLINWFYFIVLSTNKPLFCFQNARCVTKFLENNLRHLCRVFTGKNKTYLDKVGASTRWWQWSCIRMLRRIEVEWCLSKIRMSVPEFSPIKPGPENVSGVECGKGGVDEVLTKSNTQIGCQLQKKSKQPLLKWEFIRLTKVDNNEKSIISIWYSHWSNFHVQRTIFFAYKCTSDFLQQQNVALSVGFDVKNKKRVDE